MGLALVVSVPLLACSLLFDAVAAAAAYVCRTRQQDSGIIISSIALSLIDKENVKHNNIHNYTLQLPGKVTRRLLLSPSSFIQVHQGPCHRVVALAARAVSNGRHSVRNLLRLIEMWSFCFPGRFFFFVLTNAIIRYWWLLLLLLKVKRPLVVVTLEAHAPSGCDALAQLIKYYEITASQLPFYHRILFSLCLLCCG